jgi:periplasmic copper chaperone A
LIRTVFLVLLVVAFAPSVALAHSHKKNALEIVHPWTPAMTSDGVENVSVYMTIKNGSGTAERLLRVETSLAEKVDLIDIRATKGMKLPTPITALAIPARGKLELSSTGPRLLLHKFTKRLNAYDSFNLVLVFEKAGRVPIEVMVEEAETGEHNQHHQH